MSLNTLIFGLIAISGVAIGHKYEEFDGKILEKIFNNLNDLKSELEQCNSRFDESQQTFAVNDSSVFDIRYDTLPTICKTEVPPKSCAEATSCTQRSGIYRILLEKYSSEPFLVECDVKTEGGDWTLIQRRQDGSVDFYLNWDEYQRGFGKIDGEFFIGLDKLHALTNYDGPQELLVVLEYNDEIKYAKYSDFVVGNKSELYVLKHLGVYSGDAGDSLTEHLGMYFSTKDRDNNINSPNCAVRYTGAWWYNNCHFSNLNGKYGDNESGKGINWITFQGHSVSIPYAKMMIRRRRF